MGDPPTCIAAVWLKFLLNSLWVAAAPAVRQPTHVVLSVFHRSLCVGREAYEENPGRVPAVEESRLAGAARRRRFGVDSKSNPILEEKAGTDSAPRRCPCRR